MSGSRESDLSSVPPRPTNGNWAVRNKVRGGQLWGITARRGCLQRVTAYGLAYDFRGFRPARAVRGFLARGAARCRAAGTPRYIPRRDSRTSAAAFRAPNDLRQLPPERFP